MSPPYSRTHAIRTAVIEHEKWFPRLMSCRACGTPIPISPGYRLIPFGAAMITTIAELPSHAGEHLGFTDSQVMTQELVNQFADVTNDHNYIHVDVERAKQSPFGGT